VQHFTSLHREGESGEKRQVEGSVGRERVLRGECPTRIWTGWPSCSAALLPRCARPLGRGSGKGEASVRGQRGVGL
jgi:hypothetical protein